MSYQARVLYDFDAENEGELTVAEGDIITVNHVEDEWAEATSKTGGQGYVPESFIEKISGGTSLPSPPPPNISDESDFSSDDDSNFDTLPKPKAKDLKKSSSRKNLNTVDVGQQIPVNIDMERMTCKWPQPSSSYTCTVGPGEKDQKLGGIKTFVTYGLTPSFNNIKVNRRFNQFDWIHQRLVAKYGSIIVIPPLPGRELGGKFEEGLLEKRQQGFQTFVNRICCHPVLSNCELWMSWITITDDKRRKEEKRRAEKDDLVGIKIVNTIHSSVATNYEMNSALEHDIKQFSNDMTKMKDAVKLMLASAETEMGQYNSTVQTELQTVGQAFCELGFAIKEDKPIFVKIGMNFENVSKLGHAHNIKEWKPVQELFIEYKGLVDSWRKLMANYELAKNRDQGENPHVFTKFKIAIAAEKAYFREVMNEEFNKLNKAFMEEKIGFYKQMTAKLEGVFNECWP